MPLYVSEWIKRRRQQLDLTQEQLAKRACCSVFAIRKIEMGERRPSRQLAELMAKSLEIPSEDQSTFVKVARGELSIERLACLAHEFPPAEKPSPVPGNLPRLLTAFIGREPELTALGQLLGDPQCALLTIVGPGGIGKTRLAIDAAQRSRDLFPDGIWFVPLVVLNSPVQILPAIAGAMDFKFQDPANPQAQLLRYLRTKRALLVLDNAEHLRDGVGLFTEILRDCPHVKLLVTSRERLNLLSEWVFDLQGLPVPLSDQEEQFEAYSSVALFLQSARRVQLGFEVLGDERTWVIKICRILEGMPLGIELATAWVGMLSCKEIAQEIERNLDFLSVTMGDLPERHRSLRATLDYSWKLLTPEEKLILGRLSVFRGSFSREAAHEICGASLAVLSSLRNKSLLYRSEQEFYSLHEMIRQYARLKLAEHPGETERVNDRHALHYVRCLSEWEKALQGSRQLETFNEMSQVIENLSQGWQHMITSCRPKSGKNNPLCADLLHSALFSLSLFYEMRCRSLEAIELFKGSVEYLQSVRSEFEKTEDRSRFIAVLGHITAYLGLHHYYILQPEKTSEYLQEAIRLLEYSHARVEKAQVQVMLAWTYATKGQLQDSIALLEGCREVFWEEGVKWWYGLSTVHLAFDYTDLGKFQESEALFLEAFQLVESGDLRNELPLRDGFADILKLKGDFDQAEQLMRENLQLSYLFGNFRYTAWTLLDLGRIALTTQRIELAIEYIQKSIHLLTEFGETRNLAPYRLYLGKCFAAQSDQPAARAQFRQVVQESQAQGRFHLVYYGLACIARTYVAEGQIAKALEIALVLKDCSIEHKIVQDEGNCLLAELQAVLPEGQLEAALQQVDGNPSADQLQAHLLAIAREFEHE